MIVQPARVVRWEFLNVHILVMLQADCGVNVGSEEDSHRVNNIGELNSRCLA